MVHEVNYLPWFDPEDRFYSVGTLQKKADLDGERQTLMHCDVPIRLIYPSIDSTVGPFQARCTRCLQEWFAKRATDLWTQVE
jgi:hypothetical protein